MLRVENLTFTFSFMSPLFGSFHTYLLLLRIFFFFFIGVRTSFVASNRTNLSWFQLFLYLLFNKQGTRGCPKIVSPLHTTA